MHGRDSGHGQFCSKCCAIWTPAWRFWCVFVLLKQSCRFRVAFGSILYESFCNHVLTTKKNFPPPPPHLNRGIAYKWNIHDTGRAVYVSFPHRTSHEYACQLVPTCLYVYSTYVYTYMYAYIYTCIHVHIHDKIYVYIYIHIYTYIHMYVYAYTPARTWICKLWINMYIYMYVCICIYDNIYIHINVCV